MCSWRCCSEANVITADWSLSFGTLRSFLDRLFYLAVFIDHLSPASQRWRSTSLILVPRASLRVSSALADSERSYLRTRALWRVYLVLWDAANIFTSVDSPPCAQEVAQKSKKQDCIDKTFFDIDFSWSLVEWRCKLPEFIRIPCTDSCVLWAFSMSWNAFIRLLKVGNCSFGEFPNISVGFRFWKVGMRLTTLFMSTRSSISGL